jgi:hypothetical protein
LLGILGGRLPVIVIGGAPSALEDYGRAKIMFPGAFLISANQHAWELGVKAHMGVCVDQTHTRIKRPMEEVMRRFGVPIVSPLPWADYHLTDWRAKLGMSVGSGLNAMLVGILLGARAVVLCGFTWRRPSANTKEERLHKLTGNDTVRVVSGDLLELWPPMGVPAKRSKELDRLCMP